MSKEKQQKQKPPNELEQCKAERDEYLEGWKRAKADYANAKRIQEEQRGEIIKYAEERLLFELLEVVDTFDEALRQNPEDEGLQRVQMKLLSILEQHHVKKTEVSPGDAFDHHLHEAISGEGDVIDIVAGHAYHLYDKLLRPARVMVKKDAK